MASLHDDYQASFASYAWDLLAILRRNMILRPSEALPHLALDAAKWYSAHSGRPLPPTLLDPVDSGLRLTEESAASTAEALQRQQTWLSDASNSGLEDYLPALVRAFAGQNAYPYAPETLSSNAVIDVVTTALLARADGVAGAAADTVNDLTCGTGGLLVAACLLLRRLGRSPEALGQDINSAVTLVASAALFLANVPHAVFVGDSLVHDPVPEKRYSFAVADIPVRLAWHQHGAAVEKLQRHGWYPAGLPSTTDAALLFVQRLVAKMRHPDDGGARAVVLVSPRALFDPSGDRIRRWLLNKDLIEAVVALPQGLNAATNILLYAVVLSNLKGTRRQGQVQAVDLRGFYEDAGKNRPERRSLRPDALEMLHQCLADVRPTAISRTVDRAIFARRKVTLETSNAAQPQPLALAPVSVTVDAPGSEDLTTWLERRYQVAAATPRVVSVVDTAGCRLIIDDLFDPGRSELLRVLHQARWPATRLFALAPAYYYVRSVSAAGRDEVLRRQAGKRLLMVPVESHAPAVVGDPAVDAPDRRCLLVEVPSSIVRPAFLAAWLNSGSGRRARQIALERATMSASSPRTLSAQTIAQLLDELIVPVPDVGTQDGLLEADALIRATVRAAQEGQAELWRNPERRQELTRKFTLTAEEQPLVDWSRSLPYPLAAAYWAFATRRSNVHAAHRQVFLFWDAVAAFTGTVLLSALEQDASLQAQEQPQLRRALQHGHLTMERATLGAWAVLIQRLTKRFRGMLDSDEADERARLIQLFGNAPVDFLSRMLSPVLAEVLGAVMERRNAWAAHGGAASDATLQQQVGIVESQTERLRDLLGTGWRDFPLIRAGRLELSEESVFVHDVEVAVGPSAPFLQRQMTLSSPMVKGRLYLAATGAERALPLAQLVVLRPSPGASQYACYFYNRLEPTGVRLVSYQVTDPEEVTEQLPDVKRLIDGLAAPRG